MREKIIEILNQYGIRNHNKGSSAAGAPRYAIWSKGQQVSEPKPRADAMKELNELIADEIIMVCNEPY